MNFLTERFLPALPLLLMTLIPLSILYFLAGSRNALKRNGVRTTGRVIQLDEDDGTYQPTIQFYAQNEELRQFTPNMASSSYKDLLYQEVEVFYDPKNPKKVIFLHQSNVIISYILIGVIVSMLAIVILLWFIL